MWCTHNCNGVFEADTCYCLLSCLIIPHQALPLSSTILSTARKHWVPRHCRHRQLVIKHSDVNVHKRVEFWGLEGVCWRARVSLIARTLHDSSACCWASWKCLGLSGFAYILSWLGAFIFENGVWIGAGCLAILAMHVLSILNVLGRRTACKCFRILCTEALALASLHYLHLLTLRTRCLTYPSPPIHRTLPPVARRTPPYRHLAALHLLLLQFLLLQLLCFFCQHLLVALNEVFRGAAVAVGWWRPLIISWVGRLLGIFWGWFSFGD